MIDLHGLLLISKIFLRFFYFFVCVKKCLYILWVKNSILRSLIALSMEALPGSFGNWGTRTLFQGDKFPKIRGTEEHRQFSGNIESQDFVLRETRDQGDRYPPWEGLITKE